MLNLSTFVTFLFGVRYCSALVARASLPPSFSVQELGFTTEADPSYDGVGRDGGGGGLVNGQHLIVFSDTGTTKNGQLIGFTSNSVAFSNGNNPISLTDFGSNGVPNLGIPWLANETAMTTQLMQQGERLIIWPGSSITALPGGQSGISVYGVAHLHGDGSADPLYTTMVQFTPTSAGPGAERLVDTLFYPGEVQYGSFATAPSMTGAKVLLFAKSANGTDIHLARSCASTIADRSTYEVWDTTSNWTPLTSNPVPAAILSDWRTLSSGDFFYSAYLNTWVFIYFDGWADSTFYMSYSLSGFARGPYTQPVTLHTTTTPASGRYNYAGHAYAGYDASGKTVMMSWTYDGGSTEMAIVTWG